MYLSYVRYRNLSALCKLTYKRGLKLVKSWTTGVSWMKSSVFDEAIHPDLLPMRTLNVNMSRQAIWPRFWEGSLLFH